MRQWPTQHARARSPLGLRARESSPLATKLYSRETFLALIMDNERVVQEFWFELKDDGVWWVAPTPGELLGKTPSELAIRNSGAMGARDQPALPFPFTFEQFVAFEAVSYSLMEEWIANDGSCREPELSVLKQQSVDAVELVRAIASRQRPNRPDDPRPHQVEHAQEEAILRELRRQGYDPHALPRPSRSGGVKKAAWEVLKDSKALFQARGRFDKAWERLRTEGRIRDAPAFPP